MGPNHFPRRAMLQIKKKIENKEVKEVLCKNSSKWTNFALQICFDMASQTDDEVR